jgi:hypothetical protein
MASFKHIEYGLHERTVQMQGLLESAGCKDTQEYQALEEAKTLISEKTYILAVMGEFKRGKSSLINALLGSRILPADVEPTTATLNRIVFATSPFVSVCYANGTTEQVNIDELSAYVTKQGLEGDARASEINEVVIGHPSPLTQNHIEIYDTPGLNDDKRMTEIALRMIQKADMVLVPISALAPYSQVEQEFVCQLIKNQDIDHVMFVVTFLDMLGDDGIDYDYASFMSRLRSRIQSQTLALLQDDPKATERAHALLDDLNLCAISAKKALDAYARGDAKFLKESHLEEFRAQLLSTLTSRQTIATGIKVRRDIERAATLVTSTHTACIQSLQRKTEDHNKALEECKAYRESTQRLLNQFFAKEYESEEAVLQGLSTLQNEIAKCYITPLASLRTLSPTVLRLAIEHGNESRYELTENAVFRAKKEIIQVFEGVLDVIREAESAAVANLPEIPNVLLLTHNDQIASHPQSTMTQAFNAIEFYWGDPFTRMDDYSLMETNPIDLIQMEAELQTRTLVSSFEDACNATRVAFFRRFAAYASDIADWAEKYGTVPTTTTDDRLHEAQEKGRRTQAAVDEIIEHVNTLVGELDA